MYSHTAELPVIAGAPRRARRPFASVTPPLAGALLVASFCGAMAWRSATSPAQPVVDATPALVVDGGRGVDSVAFNVVLR
jgi:hypothetical protein